MIEAGVETAEERRVLEIREALARRAITEEQETVTVEVRQETLRVTKRSVPVRPAAPVEEEAAFRSEVVRIPVFGEEAVVSKRPFATGEVVVHRRPVAVPKTVAQSVRREVEESETVAVGPPDRAEQPEKPEQNAEPPEPPEPPQPPQPPQQAEQTSHDAFTEVLPVVRPAALWREVREGWSRGRSRA